MQPGSESVSDLLALMGQGDRDAEARLMDRVYPELRRLAGAYMRRERAGHTASRGNEGESGGADAMELS